MDSNTTWTLLITGAGVIVSGLVSFIIANIKIGEYKNKVDTLDATVGHDEHSGLRRTLGEVKDKVIACETLIAERGPLTKRKSPVNLTDRGEKVLVDSAGQKFIDDNYTELKDSVNSHNPTTSYDIQEVSREVVNGLKEDERINPIKEYAFKEGIELEDITEVMGIYLRNCILKEKNIEIDDIDKHETHK